MDQGEIDTHLDEIRDLVKQIANIYYASTLSGEGTMYNMIAVSDLRTKIDMRIKQIAICSIKNGEQMRERMGCDVVNDVFPPSDK